MPLDSTEIAHLVSRLRAVLDQAIDALSPDEDGKVRLTRAELGAVTTRLLGALATFLVDLLD